LDVGGIVPLTTHLTIYQHILPYCAGRFRHHSIFKYSYGIALRELYFYVECNTGLKNPEIPKLVMIFYLHVVLVISSPAMSTIPILADDGISRMKSREELFSNIDDLQIQWLKPVR
jgi:hypothetical protein